MDDENVDQERHGDSTVANAGNERYRFRRLASCAFDLLIAGHDGDELGAQFVDDTSSECHAYDRKIVIGSSPWTPCCRSTG